MWIDYNYLRSPFSDITETQMSNTEVDALIAKVIPELNNDLNLGISGERLFQIDNWRENKVNGVNTIYFPSSLFAQNNYGDYYPEFYIGDSDNDGSVDTSDLTFTEYKSDKTYADIAVSSISYDDGKVTLASAPASSSRLVWSGSISPVKQESDANCDGRLKLACGLLVKAYALKKISPKHFSKIDFESLKISKGRNDAGDEAYNQYKELIDQMRAPFKSFRFEHDIIVEGKPEFK